MNRKEFVQAYSDALRAGTASAFVGAGISMQAGYPSWKTLLKDIAVELDIDLEREHDLAGVAQWYINHSGKLRNRIAGVIKSNFPAKREVPLPLRVLSRLPLRHVWTTNYDKLIETAWELNRKTLDVKHEVPHLSLHDPHAHAALYKMHGSIDTPSDVVIAKEDYELYRRNRGAFLQLLHGHLIGLNFLFLGFSFSDPNIAYLFGLIRELMADTPNEHYAIVKRPDPAKGRSAREHERERLEKSRHKHWVSDLKRYGIRCVEIDSYDEIGEILKEVELRVARQSIFVSGSFPPDGNEYDRKYIEEISGEIGKLIAKRGWRLISGFGLTIGGAVLTGAVSELYRAANPSLERHLFLRPFPQKAPLGLSREDFLKRYREDLIAQCGICIFIAGVTKNGKSASVAQGVLDEYAIAKEMGRACIPLGTTGGASERIYEDFLAEKNRLISQNEKVKLGDKDLSVKKYIQNVESILGKLVD